MSRTAWNILTTFTEIVDQHIRNTLSKNELNRSRFRYREKINFCIEKIYFRPIQTMQKQTKTTSKNGGHRNN